MVFGVGTVGAAASPNRNVLLIAVFDQRGIADSRVDFGDPRTTRFTTTFAY